MVNGTSFTHRYVYDADNKLVEALSSRNNFTDINMWVSEARYRYYLHGPLGRVELGQNKVQGIDYSYTLQGWLKGVNSQELDPAKDMSGDGLASSSFANLGRDVYGFSLGYFGNDYKSIGAATANAFAIPFTAPSFDPTGQIRTAETGKRIV